MLSLVGLLEEAIDGGACAGHVCPEGAQLLELLGHLRGDEVVSRQTTEVALITHAGELVQQRCPTLLEAGGAVSAVEAAVHGPSGFLRLRVREDENHHVIRRKVDAFKLGTVTGRELRAFSEKERNVRAESCGDCVHLRMGEGLREPGIGERECRRRIGASAAETGRDGNPLLDSCPPAVAHSGSVCESLQSAAYKRVVIETLDRQGVRVLELDVVGQVDPLKHGDELMLSVLAQRAHDER
jgi:hypothetical protein